MELRQFAGIQIGGMFKTIYVNADTDVELRPPPGGRTYLFIQNNSAGDIYYSEGTPANVDNSILLQGGQWLELSQNLGNAVPQGNVWIKGASPTPTRQRVQVKEG